MWNDPVLITGTGRSGTSIVAGMLDYMGVHMGEALLPADKANPHGIWEEQMVHQLDLAMCFRNEKTPWGGLPPNAADVTEEEYDQRLRHILHSRGQEGQRWGLKHPPNATLIKKYYLPILGTEFPCIWCQRPKQDVIESMISHYDYPEWFTPKIVKRRWNALEDLWPKLDNTLQLELSEIKANPGNTVETLIDFLDLHPTDEQVWRAKDYVHDGRDYEKSVLVTTPTTGNLHRKTEETRVKAMLDDRYSTMLSSEVHKPTARNRNKIAKTVVENDFDFLFTIDSDNYIEKKNPLDLVELDKDIIIFPSQISGPNGVDWNVMDEVPSEGLREVPARRRRGLQEVDAGGLAAALIHRRVLEEIDAPFRDRRNEKGEITMSEDFNFCRRAREHGFHVWAHWDYPCTHHDTVSLNKFVQKRPDI